jgi:hypothetical protein
MRPRTRGDCIGGPRPCPWIGCRYSLARVEQTARGGVRIGDSTLARNANERELDAAIDHELDRLDRLGDSCSLDVADRGEHALVRVGALLGIVRERARQIQHAAFSSIPRRDLVVLRELLCADASRAPTEPTLAGEINAEQE